VWGVEARAIRGSSPQPVASEEDQMTKGKLLGLLAPMLSEVVEIESPETGQPLPEIYQPAPPLT